METTGAKAGSGNDAAPAADQERNKPGISEDALTFISPMQAADIELARRMEARKAAMFSQFAPGDEPPMADQVRRAIERMIDTAYRNQRPYAIYLGQHEYYTLRDQGPLSIDMRDGDLLFDGIPVYPVALPSHLRVYGAPR